MPAHVCKYIHIHVIYDLLHAVAVAVLQCCPDCSKHLGSVRECTMRRGNAASVHDATGWRPILHMALRTQQTLPVLRMPAIWIAVGLQRDGKPYSRHSATEECCPRQLPGFCTACKDMSPAGLR